MKQLNRYYRRSRISEHKFRQIIKYFALDLTANRTAQLTGLTHKTVNQIYLKIRFRLPQDCQRQSPFAGVVEVENRTLVRVASAVAELLVRQSSLASTNVTAKFIPRSLPIVLVERCKPLFAVA